MRGEGERGNGKIRAMGGKWLMGQKLLVENLNLATNGFNFKTSFFKYEELKISGLFIFIKLFKNKL